MNVWQSVDASSTPPPVNSLSAASVIAFDSLYKVSPANNAAIDLPTSSYRVLNWSDAGLGSDDRYEYCIDETNNQQCDSDDWITRGSTYSGDAEFALTAGHKYYWQVRIQGEEIYANGGTWWSFTVKSGTFIKIAPTNGSTITLPTTTYHLLQWSDAGIASTDRYQYCIDQTNNQLCDSNAWITRDSLYSGADEFTLTYGHTYYWQVRARDLGTYANSGTWWSFTISSTPAVPVVSSIVRASPTSSTTNASSISYTVTFNMTVTGVDATDFTLVSSGVSGAGISSVAGSGTTYTVTINTGTGDGIIILNLTDNDSIINSSGTPLGGVGAGNGDYNGPYYVIDKTPPTVLSSGPSTVATIPGRH